MGRAWHESSVSHYESAGLFRAYLMSGWRYGEMCMIWGKYHLVLASVKVSRKTTMNWWRNKRSTTIIHCIFWGSVIHENLPDCLGCCTTMVRDRAYLLGGSEPGPQTMHLEVQCKNPHLWPNQHHQNGPFCVLNIHQTSTFSNLCPHTRAWQWVWWIFMGK